MTFSEFIKPIKNALIVCAFVFYLLPFIYRFMPDEDTYFKCMYIVLHYINSITVVLTSIVLVCRRTFCWYYPLSVVALFCPTLFLYYNSYPELATFYMLAYGIFSYIGWPAGIIIRKILEKNKDGHL